MDDFRGKRSLPQVNPRGTEGERHIQPVVHHHTRGRASGAADRRFGHGQQFSCREVFFANLYNVNPRANRLRNARAKGTYVRAAAGGLIGSGQCLAVGDVAEPEGSHGRTYGRFMNRPYQTRAERSGPGPTGAGNATTQILPARRPRARGRIPRRARNSCA